MKPEGASLRGSGASKPAAGAGKNSTPYLPFGAARKVTEVKNLHKHLEVKAALITRVLGN